MKQMGNIFKAKTWQLVCTCLVGKIIRIRKIAGVCNLRIEKKEYIFDRAFIFEIPNFTDAVIVKKNVNLDLNYAEFKYE